MNRRALLKTAPLAATSLVVAACGANGSAPTPAQVVADVKNAITQVQNDLPLIPANLVPAATLATLKEDLVTAQTAAAALSASLPATQSASLMQTIDGYLNAFVNAFASISGVLPAPFNVVVPAIALILPEAEQFIGNTFGVASAPLKKPVKIPAGMTLASARQVLATGK